MTDADKLLAVCRVVWPEREWKVMGGEVGAWSGIASCPTTFTLLDLTSLDDIRRVMLALAPGQRARFNHQFSLQIGQKKHGNICRPSPSVTLIAEPVQILDALWRAVCPE